MTKESDKKTTTTTEKQAEKFDFSAFDVSAEAERGAELPLRNPKTGQKTGVIFEVYGTDSRAYRTNLRRLRDAVAANPEREPTDEDDAMLLGRAREAAAAMRGWSAGDPVLVDGGRIEFSVENAIELFVKYSWAADQVLSFINIRGNFSAA